MKKISPSSKQYGYVFLGQFSGFILMLVPSILAVVVYKHGGFLVAVVWAFVACFFAFVGLGTFFGYSALDVSDEGVTAYKMGLRMKTIRWQDVEKVKQNRFWNAKSRRYSIKFFIFDHEVGASNFLLPNMHNSPIVFMDRIRGRSDLVGRINGYAQQYGFPLILLDREKGRTEQRVSKF